MSVRAGDVKCPVCGGGWVNVAEGLEIGVLHCDEDFLLLPVFVGSTIVAGQCAQGHHFALHARADGSSEVLGPAQRATNSDGTPRE